MNIDQRYAIRFLRAIQLLIAMAAVSLFTGCANLGGLPGFSLSKSGTPEPTSPHGICTVEIHDGGKPETITVPLNPESRVQSVLDESDTSDRFRKMKIYVARQSPRNPEEQVRLKSVIDPKSNKIKLETDYAIVNGDKIVVVEDKSTKLDKTLGAILPF